jgi:hypothetical protein
MRSNAEFKLHCAAVRYLRTVAPDCITIHVANGEYRSDATAGRLKAMGVVPGIFDLLILAPDGRCFFAEAKSAKGKLSPWQEWFRGELIRRGIPYVIFKSLDDLELFIDQHSIPNRIAKSAKRQAKLAL